MRLQTIQAPKIETTNLLQVRTNEERIDPMRVLKAFLCSILCTGPAAAGPNPIAATEWTQLANNAELAALVATEGRSLAQLSQILGAEFEQIRTQTQTYQTILQNTQTLGETFLRDAMEPVIKLRSVLEQAGALANDGKALDEFLRSDLVTDPLYQSNNLDRTGIAERYDQWSKQWNKSLDASLRGSGLTLQDVATEANLLESLSSMLGREDGHLKALQLANQVSAQMSRQMIDLRSLTALQVEQNGIAWSRVIADMDAEEAERRDSEVRLQQTRKELENERQKSRGINDILGIGN